MPRILYLYHQKMNTRGVAMNARNILNVDIPDVTVDMIQWRNKEGVGYFDLESAYYWEDLTEDDVVSIADTYDYVILNYFAGIPIEDLSYWPKISKAVKIWIHSDSLITSKTYTAIRSALSTSDGIFTFSLDNNLSRKIRSSDPELTWNLKIRRPGIAWNLYKDTVNESLSHHKDLPYIPETGFWHSIKNSIEISRMLDRANTLGVRFEDFIWLHLGISFAPQIFFQHISIHPDVTVKCGRKLDRYMDMESMRWIDGKSPVWPDDPVNKIFLMRNYEPEWIYEFLGRCYFSYSFMSPINSLGKRDNNVAPRFDFSMIEKCLFTLPIFTKEFVNMFDDMGEIANIFPTVSLADSDSYDKSIRNLGGTLKELQEDHVEYNARRAKLIDYIRREHSVDNLIRDILKIEKPR